MAYFAPFAPVDRDVELLLATPRRQKRRQLKNQVSDTPDKEAPPTKARRVLQRSASSSKASVQTPSKVENSKTVTPGVAVRTAEALAEDAALITKLFDGLESVLVLLASRRARPTIAATREHVGHATQRELSDERLQQILAVAGNMLEATWVRGLELVQRLEDGDVRAPTNVEKAIRHTAFCARLDVLVKQAAANQQPLPRKAFPAKPGAQEPSAAQPDVGSSPAVKESAQAQGPPAVAPAKVGGSRLDALRQRIQARQATERCRNEHLAKVSAVEGRIVTCEDALAVHAILVHLFARGEGADSAASEAEVVSGICSAGFSMQSRRTIESEAARVALAQLTKKATSWYTARMPEHSQRTGLILRRLPEGNSLDSTEALQEEILALQAEKRALLLKGPEAPVRKMRLVKKTKVA